MYNDSVSSFQDLLNKDNSFTIHHQNIKSLATEICKTLRKGKNNLPGGTFEGFFTLGADSYSLRSEQEFSKSKQVKTSLKYFGTELNSK